MLSTVMAMSCLWDMGKPRPYTYWDCTVSCWVELLDQNTQLVAHVRFTLPKTSTTYGMSKLSSSDWIMPELAVAATSEHTRCSTVFVWCEPRAFKHPIPSHQHSRVSYPCLSPLGWPLGACHHVLQARTQAAVTHNRHSQTPLLAHAWQHSAQPACQGSTHSPFQLSSL